MVSRQEFYFERVDGIKFILFITLFFTYSITFVIIIEFWVF